MSSTINNGSQVLTFDYRQEGTSEGFNKLLYTLIPQGIIEGGSLSNTAGGLTVDIAPMVCYFKDTTNQVGVRLETTDNARLSVSASNPYIVGDFTWINTENNFMEFKAVANPNEYQIVFGKAIVNGANISDFDYTYKTWSKEHYESFTDENPSFKVTVSTVNETTLNVGVGKAIINGKEIIFTENKTFNFSQGDYLHITNQKIMFLCIKDDGELTVISSNDSLTPTLPTIPSNCLAIAKITLGANPTSLLGTFTGNNKVEYIYNNHFQSNSVDASVDDKIDTAINALDVGGKGGDGRYISTISETDGKISATEKTLITDLSTITTSSSTGHDVAPDSWAVKNALNDKVDKESGKGLSTNDFTNTLKTKLEGLTVNNGTLTLKQTGKSDVIFSANSSENKEFKLEEFTGATSNTNGTSGLVKQPTITDKTKFLCGDGSWKDPADTTYSADETTLNLNSSTKVFSAKTNDGIIQNGTGLATSGQIYTALVDKQNKITNTDKSATPIDNDKLSGFGTTNNATDTTKTNTWTFTKIWDWIKGKIASADIGSTTKPVYWNNANGAFTAVSDNNGKVDLSKDATASGYSANLYSSNPEFGVKGTLGIGNGGTGATSFTQGAVLIGNGSNAVTTKAIDTTPTLNSDNLITSGGVYSHFGKFPLDTESTLLDNVSNPYVDMRLRIDKFIVYFEYKYQVYNPFKVSAMGSTSEIPEFKFKDLPDGYIIFMFYNNTPYKIKFTFIFDPIQIAFTELISNQRYTSSEFSVTVNTETSICLQGYVR